MNKKPITGILKSKKLNTMEYSTMETRTISKNRNVFRPILTFSWLTKKAIVEIIVHLFIILFLYTGISKAMDFMVFEEQISESPVLEPVAPIIAWGLPLLELAVSILLFFPRHRIKGLYASFGLMILFTGYVIAIISIDKELPCSCGGIIEALSWQGHLIFNCVFTTLAWVAIVIQRKLQTSM